ncbi:MAG TPA: PepSY domain-containing protein [Ramlibacter sp.]|nr:PepSY domain-containing protein [Ramlibacter sp.]
MKLLAHCLCCVALVASAVPAWADIGRDQAAAVAQRLGGGRVLSVDKSESGSRPVWRVKVVTAQGEVKVILIDAASGQPM